MYKYTTIEQKLKVMHVLNTWWCVYKKTTSLFVFDFHMNLQFWLQKQSRYIPPMTRLNHNVIYLLDIFRFPLMFNTIKQILKESNVKYCKFEILTSELLSSILFVLSSILFVLSSILFVLSSILFVTLLWFSTSVWRTCFFKN